MGQTMGSILPRMTLCGCQATPTMPAPGFPTSPAVWGPGSRPSPRPPQPPSRAVLLLLRPARLHTCSVSLCPPSPARSCSLSRAELQRPTEPAPNCWWGGPPHAPLLPSNCDGTPACPVPPSCDPMGSAAYNLAQPACVVSLPSEPHADAPAHQTPSL